MLGILKKVFGSKHDKDVKALLPIVEEINAIYPTYASLSDDELRATTQSFRDIVQGAAQALVDEAAEIRRRLHEDDTLSHNDRADAYARLAELDKEQFAAMQAALDDILPKAFALVKEACRRLVGMRYMVVGNEQVWDMIPYDVQLIGGMVLHSGKISEMATGEGKTLVATLPLYLNSLAGRGVHLVTVNDYLARRDREWMKPIFDMLGVSTGCIQSNMPPHVRKSEYNADITYGTNNEFGFDYLRDNMVTSSDDMVQRPHWFAIVDEVDSVLIDEARTPLIISGPVTTASSDKAFVDMNPRVRRLYDVQAKLANTLVADAEKLLQSGKKEDTTKAGIALLRAHRAMPKHGRLAKVLQDPDNMKLMRDTELDHLRDQGQRMHEIDDELYFTVDEKNHQIDISEKGRALLATANEDPEMFVIPDIAAQMSAIEGNADMLPDDRQTQKDEVMRLFAERSDRIHIINQLLRAYTLYDIDDEYVVQDGKVKIVDEFTGRILEGRRYSDGLHQAIEAKEGVIVEQDTQTFATITLQNYFRLYHKLAGMTGTAETEAGEFYEIYKLDVVVIPTNRSIQRKDLDDLIYRTKREKYNAVVEAVQHHLNEGRAVLVGTTSVEVSEVLSKMLKRANVMHNVLNAKQHQREAEIVANAGRKSAVTIATNMAGRGTDIKLDADVKANGGLVIIGTERHEARRIDRQLRGRAGRQGDPGSSQFFISLEDDLMRLFGGERIAAVMQRLKVPEGEPIQAGMVTKSVENAQKKVETNNFGIRKRLLEYDNVMNQQREVVYDRRKHALMGDRLKTDLYEYVREMAEDWYDEFHPDGDVQGFKNAARATLLCDPSFADTAFGGMSKADAVADVVAAATDFYDRKEDMLGPDFMAALERVAALQSIDDRWREHLRGMDDLKEGIYLRAYGQKDPLLEYKQEAYRIFIELVKDINKDTVHFAFKYYPRVVERQSTRESADQAAPTPQAVATTPSAPVPQLRTASASRPLSFSHPTATSSFGGTPQQAESTPSTTVRNAAAKVGRNEPCPCGSGKKFKACHGLGGATTYNG
ncbi:MAG: preprotein translocase subunit SecA [Candidatus Kapabacteria bacterium]|nr:preprotein translocase subunit SecA [Candidatus Kapabacteria bacterium]